MADNPYFNDPGEPFRLIAASILQGSKVKEQRKQQAFNNQMDQQHLLLSQQLAEQGKKEFEAQQAQEAQKQKWDIFDNAAKTQIGQADNIVKNIDYKLSTQGKISSQEKTQREVAAAQRDYTAGLYNDPNAADKFVNGKLPLQPAFQFLSPQTKNPSITPAVEPSKTFNLGISDKQISSMSPWMKSVVKSNTDAVNTAYGDWRDAKNEVNAMNSSADVYSRMEQQNILAREKDARNNLAKVKATANDNIQSAPFTEQKANLDMQTAARVNAKAGVELQHAQNTLAMDPLDYKMKYAKTMSEITDLNNKGTTDFTSGLDKYIKTRSDELGKDATLPSHAQLTADYLKTPEGQQLHSGLTMDIPKSIRQTVVKQVAGDTGVDENLIDSMIKQESGYNARALSKKGAMGLMQLMPGTAQGLGVKNAYDPVQNVFGGTKYLMQQVDAVKKMKVNPETGKPMRPEDVLGLALIRYNAGPTVNMKDIPKESRIYRDSILRRYNSTILQTDPDTVTQFANNQIDMWEKQGQTKEQVIANMKKHGETPQVISIYDSIWNERNRQRASAMQKQRSNIIGQLGDRLNTIGSGVPTFAGMKGF